MCGLDLSYSFAPAQILCSRLLASICGCVAPVHHNHGPWLQPTPAALLSDSKPVPLQLLGVDQAHCQAFLALAQWCHCLCLSSPSRGKLDSVASKFSNDCCVVFRKATYMGPWVHQQQQHCPLRLLFSWLGMPDFVATCFADCVTSISSSTEAMVTNVSSALLCCISWTSILWASSANLSECVHCLAGASGRPGCLSTFDMCVHQGEVSGFKDCIKSDWTNDWGKWGMQKQVLMLSGKGMQVCNPSLLPFCMLKTISAS